MFAPSRTINLFVRLALHELNGYTQYKAELTIKNFRQELVNPEFKEKLNQFINDEDKISVKLFGQLVELLEVQNENYQLPKIYIKELLRKNADLVVVILSYLHRNKESISQNIRQILHHLFLLNHDGKKTARQLFRLLSEFQWDLDGAFNELLQNDDLIIQVVTPAVFQEMIIDVMLPEYQIENGQHFAWHELLEPAFEKNGSQLIEIADGFVVKSIQNEEVEINSRKAFINNFKCLADNFYWQRIHLIASQASYFNQQFKDYLEFEGIEDTNRPWDWDHIYPHSWVYNRKNISIKIRWIVNLNGNFRALSYDENRSESNTFSPSQRLEDHKHRSNAFVFSEEGNNFLNDWQFWKQINDNYNENKNNVELLTNAMFYRIVNIYKNWYLNIYLQNP
jgi:hypothetical protein